MANVPNIIVVVINNAPAAEAVKVAVVHPTVVATATDLNLNKLG
jgi:hypothetical protein